MKRLVELFICFLLIQGNVLAATVELAVPKDTKATLHIFMRNKEHFVQQSKRAAAEFKQKYPNVTLEFQYVPYATWSDYINSFQNQMASGDAPDIFESPIEAFTAISSKGVLIDLDAFVAEDLEVQTEFNDIEENLLEKIRSPLTGELNYFPLEWNSIVIYYNKDMFDRAGISYPSDNWTWGEFLQKAQKLTKRDTNGNVSQYGYIVPGYDFGLTPWFLNNGTDKVDGKWQAPTVKEPAFAETLNFLHDLIYRYRVAPSYSAGDVGDKQFIALQAAMFSAGRWVTQGIRDAGLQNVGIVMPPAKSVNNTTVFGIGGIGILKSSKHKQLAWEFVKSFAGNEFQRGISEDGRSIPVNRKWATTDEFQAFPDNGELYYKTATLAQPIASPPYYAQMQDIFERHIGAYLTNNISLEETIAGMNYELSRAIERWKKRR
jgi:multiple sugar transport system substrate-binding protein